MLRIGVERGVSTVVDVSMALLLITASVTIVGYSLASTDRGTGGGGADAAVIGGDEFDGAIDTSPATRTTTVLSESTISVTYSIEDVRAEEGFSEPTITDATTYRRTDHGSPLGLLADAAVTNYRIDGQPILAYGETYEADVDWAIRRSLLGAERNFYVVAEWEPYEGAGINGTATAGERPPADADVSGTTTTVPSGFSAVNETALEEGWRSDRFDGLGGVIGEEIIAGLFPLEPSQYALEDQGIDRELAVYRYLATADAVDRFSFRSPDTHPPLVRSKASAETANRRLLVGQEGGYEFTDSDGFAAWIAADLPRAFATELERIETEYDGHERDERTVEAVRDGLSTEYVTITIQTWDE